MNLLPVSEPFALLDFVFLTPPCPSTPFLFFVSLPPALCNVLHENPGLYVGINAQRREHKSSHHLYGS